MTKHKTELIHVYQIDFDSENYWIRRALEETLPMTDGVALDNVKFLSHGVAIETAKAVLLKYAELTPYTRGSFNSTYDRKLASVAFKEDLSMASIEGRFVGDPRIEVTDNGSVSLKRPTQARFVGRKKTIKTALIDGETYTKETTEEISSPWFPGVIETVTLWLSGSQVLFFEEDKGVHLEEER
jgi:hypothetical protein